MTPPYLVKSGSDAPNFSSAPINPAWILEGNPVARVELLSSSADATASTYYWDCTAGRFNWFYGFDETLFILEGDFTLKSPEGEVRHIKTGDSVFFPKGAQAEWTVPKYVRKLAFCRTPEYTALTSSKRIARRVRRIIRGGNQAEKAGLF